MSQISILFPTTRIMWYPEMLQRILSRHSKPQIYRQLSTTPKPNPSSSTSPPKTSISFKSLNAFAVSQSSAGGSRNGIPPKLPADRLSPEYRSKARKITLAMIAAPIAIVLSYVLAMRTWGGRERLVFPKDWKISLPLEGQSRIGTWDKGLKRSQLR